MDQRSPGPLEALLKAVEAGDLDRARALARVLARGPAHNPMQLAAEVLHELKQPLLGIKGYMQMLADDEGPHRPVVPLVLSQVERIEQITSDFIRLASNQRAPTQRLALESHVRDAVAAFHRNPDSARVQVDVDAAPGLEITGNPRLVEQLLLNLLNNARDAMGGRGRVKVVTAVEDGSATLLVADWGPGIAPEVRARLFEPYATGRARGNGLGLAVSKRIAEEHGATIELGPPSAVRESPPPATVFRVRFPPDVSALSARKRLLVVDDEAVIRQIFRDLLSKECEVVDADAAEAALTRLRSGERFDLIVTDKNLPGLSGLELAQEARRLDPASKVMVMTGYPSLVTAQQALELGVVDYLLKPFDDIRQVREKIRAALSASDEPQAGAASARVDVYEDDAHSARAISEALRELGLEARVLDQPVPGGEEAPAGVIVSWDFKPARAGAALELGRRMAKGAPFVVLVEKLSLETTLEALRSGCAACLPRLVSDPKALARELARALEP